MYRADYKAADEEHGVEPYAVKVRHFRRGGNAGLQSGVGHESLDHHVVFSLCLDAAWIDGCRYLLRENPYQA